MLLKQFAAEFICLCITWLKNKMNWQLGYTPANLRGIMEKHGLSNQDVAERAEVTSIRQVQYWLSGAKDMPLHRWNKLLQSVGEFPKGTAKEPTIVKAVRLPLELVETHQINSDWLLDAVMNKLLTPHNGRGCIGQGCLLCEEEDAEPY